MPHQKVVAIKSWIKGMGFKLVKSHHINRRTIKINYYSLGSFGIYEEISRPVNLGKINTEKDCKFISWTPWGINFEVSSAKELSKAYEESLLLNPDAVLN